MIYDTNTLYVTGMSKSNNNNMDPITKMYNSISFLGLILDKDTDIIIDVTCNTISDITNDFIKRKTILVGKNLVKDVNNIILEIK